MSPRGITVPSYGLSQRRVPALPLPAMSFCVAAMSSPAPFVGRHSSRCTGMIIAGGGGVTGGAPPLPLAPPPPRAPAGSVRVMRVPPPLFEPTVRNIPPAPAAPVPCPPSPIASPPLPPLDGERDDAPQPSMMQAMAITQCFMIVDLPRCPWMD